MTRNRQRRNNAGNNPLILSLISRNQHRVYIFVNPSLWEGLPFILLEAMLYKKPVVAIKATGTIDVMKDGENGFLVPPRSPKLLSEKIKLVLDDPDLAGKVGEQAKKTVENNYSVDKTIPLIEKLYLQLFNKKANPSLQKATQP